MSGDPETVHQAGISARGRTVSEEGIDVEDYEDYLVTWPLEVGKTWTSSHEITNFINGTKQKVTTQ